MMPVVRIPIQENEQLIMQTLRNLISNINPNIQLKQGYDNWPFSMRLAGHFHAHMHSSNGSLDSRSASTKKLREFLTDRSLPLSCSITVFWYPTRYQGKSRFDANLAKIEESNYGSSTLFMSRSN
jgi:hypothetical protein